MYGSFFFKQVMGEKARLYVRRCNVKTRIHNTLVMQLTGIIGGVLHPVSQITALTQTVIPFLRRIYTEDKFFESLNEFTKNINYFQFRVRSKF